MPGILSRLLGRGAPETRRAAGLLGSTPLGFTGTGGPAPVSPVAAENLSTVTACVSAIAGGLASLPARIYRVRGEERTEQPGHPVARLILRPNGFQTWPDLIETWLGSTLLYGNGLIAVESDSAGRPLALAPVPWPDVQPVLLPSGRLAYDVAQGGAERRRLLDSEVLHLKDRADGSGHIGRSRLSRAADVLAAATGAQRFSASLWDNAAAPSGLLTVPRGISSDGFKRMRAQFETEHTGPQNARKVVFMDEGSAWTPLSTSPEDAELLSSRRYSGEELARLFGVPPAIIGDLSHGTFTNSETAGRFFAMFCLAGWARKIEAELSRNLLDPDHHLEIDLSGLTRGDDAARWAAHKIAVETGVLSADEVRQVEGWNPRPAGTAPVPPAGAAAADSAPAAPGPGVA